MIVLGVCTSKYVGLLLDCAIYMPVTNGLKPQPHDKVKIVLTPATWN